MARTAKSTRGGGGASAAKRLTLARVRLSTEVQIVGLELRECGVKGFERVAIGLRQKQSAVSQACTGLHITGQSAPIRRSRCAHFCL